MKLLEIIQLKYIKELILLIKEAKEFYIVNDNSNYAYFDKYLFEKAYKEVETGNKYLKNYIDDTKTFIEDGNIWICKNQRIKWNSKRQ